MYIVEIVKTLVKTGLKFSHLFAHTAHWGFDYNPSDDVLIQIIKRKTQLKALTSVSKMTTRTSASIKIPVSIKEDSWSSIR
jgi:hypothetical protein